MNDPCPICGRAQCTDPALHVLMVEVRRAVVARMSEVMDAEFDRVMRHG